MHLLFILFDFTIVFCFAWDDYVASFCNSPGFNMYRELAYSPVLSIADQHTGLLNMLRSPIFALGSLGVGNRPAAGLHRTIGISATPPSLWPGCELQKYLL